LTIGYMFGSRYYLNSGTLQQISVYCGGSATGNIAVAIYTDISGVPGTYLIESGSQAMQNGWNNVPLNFNIMIAGYYWLAFQFSANGAFFNFDTVGIPANCENTIMTGGGFPTWPGTWGVGTSNTSLFSMYAVVCAQETATMTLTNTPTPTLTAINIGTPIPTATPYSTPGGLHSLSGNIVTDGVVNAVAAGASGVYLGGLFNYVGHRTGEGVELNQATGDIFPGMPKISGGTSYGVETAISDGAGGWYIGGDFKSVAGQADAGIAHILSNGVVDTQFNPGVNGAVMGLALDSSGNLFACGFFTVIDGQNRTYIAKMNAATGAVDPSFNPTVTGNYVQSLALDGAGNIYLGGTFTNISGQTMSCLAKLNASTGAVDPNFIANPNATAHAIELDKTGSLYVAGDFSTIGSGTHSMVAKVNASTGLADAGFNPVVDSGMQSLALDGNGNLFIGGWFTHINGVTRNYMAKISASTGVLDNSFNPSADAPVYPLALDGAGNIYAGGNFKNIGGQATWHIAKMNATTGALDTTFSSYADGNVETIALDGNGNIFVGGLFNSIGGQLRTNIAKLNGDGTAIDPVFNIDCNNAVLCLLLGGDGSLYAGGEFTAIASSPRMNIAKLDPLTGVPDPGFNPGAGAWVYALALDASQNLYVGGLFTMIDSVSRPHLAKINALNGAIDATFNAAGADSPVYSLALDGKGNIYAGGSFLNIGGLSRNLIAKLDAVSGNGDTAFNATAVGTTVTTVALDGAGNIYAGGVFSTIGGISRNNIAMLSASTGAADGTFNITADNAVNTLITDGSGDIYAGGNFGTIGGQAMGFLVKIFMTAGNIDTTFAPQPDNQVNALCFSPDRTTLYVGGSFTSIYGIPRSNFAAIHMISGIATPTATYTPTATTTFIQSVTETNTFTITSTMTETLTATLTATPTETVTVTTTSTPAPDENNVLDRNYVDTYNGGAVTIKVNVSYIGLPIGIKVYSLNGELVRRIDSLSYAVGWNSVVWDVKNDGGRMVGQGVYFVEINAQGVKKIRRIYVLK
jgi:hypothetical protein